MTADELALEELLKFYTYHHSHCFPPTDYPEGACHCGLDELITKLRRALRPRDSDQQRGSNEAQKHLIKSS